MEAWTFQNLFYLQKSLFASKLSYNNNITKAFIFLGWTSKSVSFLYKFI